MKISPAQIEAASMLLDRDEGGTGSLDWARNFIRTGIDAVHDGDCTNQSHSCHRCQTDRAIADAIAIEAALTAAAEVKPETTMEHIARDIRDGHFPRKSAAAEVDIEDCDGDLAEIEQIVESRAAAEVEKPSKMFAYISGQSEGNIAELEAREEYALGKLGLVLEENEKLRADLAATIERCAQVADNEEEASEVENTEKIIEGYGYGWRASFESTIEQCAQVAARWGAGEIVLAAIRALKDKP